MEVAADGLGAVRDLFESTHWTQGRMNRHENGKHTYCAVGGLRHVFVGDAYPDESDLTSSVEYMQAVRALVILLAGRGYRLAQDAMREYLSDFDGGDEYAQPMALTVFERAIIEWNDDVLRSLKDVLNLLDLAQRAIAA